MSNKTDNLCVCVVGLGGGGFHAESELILSQVNSELDCVLVFSGPNGGILRWNVTGEPKASYKVISPLLMGEGYWRLIYRLPLNFILAMYILIAQRVDVVFGVGTIQFIPFALAARLLGKQSWFFESVTRVKKPSLTGVILSKLPLANRVYYCWYTLSGYFKNGRLSIGREGGV